MTVDLKRRVFIGIWRFMIPVPQALIRRGISRTADAICRKTVEVSAEERKVHRFVVLALTETNEPVTPEDIAEKLDIPLERVRSMIDTSHPTLWSKGSFWTRINTDEILINQCSSVLVRVLYLKL